MARAHEPPIPPERIEETPRAVPRGGRRTEPYAFTEQGMAMLSAVVNSARAIAVKVGIIRTFVRLRRLLLSREELSRKLLALERRLDRQFDLELSGGSSRPSAAANRYASAHSELPLRVPDNLP